MAGRQLKINFSEPLASGELNGVKWRSLTSIGQAQSDTLEYYLIEHNRNRRIFGLDEVGVAEMVKQRWGCTVGHWSQKVFTRLMYNETRSNYGNNYKVLPKQ